METSALVSIQDLLREHEEQLAHAKRETERAAHRAVEERVAAAERAREEAAALERAEANAAEAKRREEERHQAEMAAFHQAAIARAKADADAAERAQVARANADHEVELASIANDRGKKRWRAGSIVTAALLGLAVIVGTSSIDAAQKREVAAEAEVQSLRAQLENAESAKAQLQTQLKSAHDPETIAKLEADIAAKDAEIARLRGQPKKAAPAPAPVPVPSASVVTNEAPCTCMYASDPFCDHTRHCKILHPDQ
jgi:hypothetical protein